MAFRSLFFGSGLGVFDAFADEPPENPDRSKESSEEEESDPDSGNCIMKTFPPASRLGVRRIKKLEKVDRF
jgi:hypothetical protein